MKRAFYLLLGTALGLVLGTLAAWCFNHWYGERFVKSDDDANLLVSLLLFGLWPAFAIAGAAAGHRLYKGRAAISAARH